MIAAATGLPGCIREFTSQVAAVVAAEHARDPMGELLVWLQMALRREASVGEIYGVANLAERLARVRAPRAIVDLLRVTIGNIWAQEKAHAAYLEAVSMAVARPSTVWRRLRARLDAFMGAIEGQVMCGRTSARNVPRLRAALMLAIGRRVHDVPEFVSTLSALSFGDFCRLNAELEITAVHGYERMLLLLDSVPDGVAHGTFVVDVQRMIVDERFHHRAFETMEAWFAGAGDTMRPGLSHCTCVEQLGTIRADLYGR